MTKHIIMALLLAGVGIPIGTIGQNVFNLPGISANDSAFALPGISLENLLANAPPCSTTGCTILPITLLQFTANRQSNTQVLLQWETTNEYNLAGFGVERSFGNTSDFAPTTFVDSKSGTAIKKQYTLPDPNAFAGTTYYRLRQTDVDGKFVYSNTISVKGYAHTETLTVYPNPVKANLQIGLYATKNGNTALSILNEAGKTVYQQSIRLYTGSNTSTSSVSFLPPGTYVAKMVTPAGTLLVSKFVKQ